ncbi:MAG: HK97 gp10 family phage protein [Mangrovicoccus sp.]
MATSAKLNPRLKAQLERTPEIAVQAAAQAMEEGADEIVAFMKSLVPVRSGDLRSSIAWTWGDAPKGSLVIDEIRSGRNAGMQYATLRITFYVGEWYGRLVEFGTSPHAQPNRGTDHPGTTAKPFFYPAWRAKEASFKRKIKSAVRRAIKEAIHA